MVALTLSRACLLIVYILSKFNNIVSLVSKGALLQCLKQCPHDFTGVFSLLCAPKWLSFFPRKVMPMSLSRRPGAPKGNFNALKHGFYTRRLKKRDLTGVESTDVSGLIEEIALIRVFTRRLIESCAPEADAYELAEILRILCLASSTITRVVKTQYLLSTTDTGLGDEIDEAIRQVNAELRQKLPPLPRVMSKQISPLQPISLHLIRSH